MSNTEEMRKLMESFQPTQTMEYDEVPVGEMPDNNMHDEEMGGVDTVDKDIIDVLQNEFKRLTTEFLQSGGELDEAGLADVREKLGKHMTSILDVLHDGWMDNMMGSDAPDTDGADDVETPFATDDDAGESDSDETEDDDSEEKDDDDSDEEKADDSDDDDGEEKDDDSEEDEEEFDFDKAHINESPSYAMGKLRDKILKG